MRQLRPPRLARHGSGRRHGRSDTSLRPRPGRLVSEAIGTYDAVACRRHGFWCRSCGGLRGVMAVDQQCAGCIGREGHGLGAGGVDLFGSLVRAGEPPHHGVLAEPGRRVGG